MGPSRLRAVRRGRGADARHLHRLRRHLGRGRPQLVWCLCPRVLPLLLPRPALGRMGRCQQLRRRLRHDRGGAEPPLALRRLRDAPPAERHRRRGRHHRRVEARPLPRRAARRVHRRAVPAADAQLLRADVQQPEGHPLRGRHGLGDVLPRSHRAGAAAAALDAGGEARDRLRPGAASASSSPNPGPASGGCCCRCCW